MSRPFYLIEERARLVWIIEHMRGLQRAKIIGRPTALLRKLFVHDHDVEFEVNDRGDVILSDDDEMLFRLTI